MSEPSNDSQDGEEVSGGGTGRALREARMAAGIDAKKMCADLRLSLQVLEALERGDYRSLPGDPYARALLGSVSRYLNLDAQAVVAQYHREIGAAPNASSVTPYKDRDPVHRTAHKQIFVIIVIALFVLLFFLVGRLNKGELAQVPALGPAAVSQAVPEIPGAPSLSDSAPESRALMPDSGPAGAAEPDSARRAAAIAAVAADSAKLTVAVIKPLLDSVSIKVRRSGKEDFTAVLRLGKEIQVSHLDTITVFLAKPKSVQVTLGDNSLIPDRKRFKIFDRTLITF